MKKQYINKANVIAEIERLDNFWHLSKNAGGQAFVERLLSFLDTLEVKEVDLTDGKTNWCPSKKQMDSLHDLLEYNIGVFDYQKYMEVNSLYEDLTKILDYEANRQK